MKESLSKVLKVGDNISIEIQKNDSSYLRLKSNVQKIFSDNKIAISTPILEGKLFPIQVGTKIYIIFNKKNTGKYYFMGEVIKRENMSRLSLLYINKIGKIRKLQRRSYYRLNIVLNVTLDIIENNSSIKTIDCITKDISGGGIRAICKEKIPVGSTVSCKIPLDNECITVLGEIIRSQKLNDSLINYDTAIKFYEFEENKRTKLIKFIFDKQSKLIKKGLI